MDINTSISEKRKRFRKENRAYKKLSKMNEIKLTNTSSKNNLKKRKRTSPYRARAAIYIGHIPHGFYEDEMSAYFNQFGKVHSAVVARSKKTGRSRGYGFVEFEDEEVAKIAAETMNNYLMFNRVLKCRYISPEERKCGISVRTTFPLRKTENRIVDSTNKRRAFVALDQASYQKKTQKKINDFKKFFDERGIDFSFKINFVDLNDPKTKGSKNLETESLTSRGSESKDDTDDQFGVLEIDESDSDIDFKTPPQVKKVIKRNLSRPTSANATPNDVEGQGKRKKLKKPSVPEKGKHKASEGETTPKGVGKKLGKKPLLKSFKLKTAQSQKKSAESLRFSARLQKKKEIKK